jgi:nucleoside-diphosphate kinase
VDRILREERERPLSSPKAQRTFSFLKPESIKKGIVGNVLTRLERRGFVFRRLELHHITRKEADELYNIHRTKPFFQELVEHVTSGPVLLMVLEGPDAVETVRKMVGATNPLLAEPGTIRADFSMSITGNTIHASDSLENAKREASIFFREAI